MRMQALDDIALLQEYSTNGSEIAFETLVARHVSFVYSAAFRQVRDPAAAEDITQAVFILLARKAPRIGEKVVMAGWLFKTTRFVALAHVRQNARRCDSEQEAQMQFDTQVGTSEDFWTQMSPLLDEAVASLREKDRQAILLRYFENKQLSEVGTQLGLGEDGARMRVNRALEKLRKFFTKRRIATTSVIIAGELSARSVQAAPSVLTKTATTVALANSAVGPTVSLADGATRLMVRANLKIAGAAVLSLLLAIVVVAIIQDLTDKSIRGIPAGWSALTGCMCQWSWDGGKIVGRSTNADTILASTQKYSDFTMSSVVTARNREASLAIRMQDYGNGYLVVFVPAGTAWAKEYGSHISLVKRISGREVAIAHAFKGPGISTSAHKAKVTITAKGPQIDVYLNDKPVIHAKDNTFSSGSIGFRIYGDPEMPCDATFAKLTIEEQGTYARK